MPGDTFDAGTVYAQARLGRDEFQRDLAQLRRDMAAFERQQFDVPVGMNQTKLDRDAAQAKRTIKDVGNQQANPKIGANDKTFTERMFSIRATLKQVNEIVSTPTILVEILQSMRRVAELKYELRDLARSYVIDIIVYPQAFKEINRISDSMLSLQNVARVAIPSLTPLLAAVAGQATIIASSLVSAGGAAGVFALAAIPALVGIAEKTKAIADAQEKVNITQQYAGFSDKQRKTALLNLEVALGAVSAQEKQAVADTQAIQAAWTKWQEAIQPAVFAALHAAVAPIESLLPRLIPVVEAVSTLMIAWMQQLDEGIQSGGFARFTAWLAGDGIRNLNRYGLAIGNFVMGFTNLMMGTSGETFKFSQGLLTLSERFLTWSQTLESNQQFQEWMRFTTAVMPQVMSILTQLLPILLELHRIFAPITEAVINFVAGFMQAHPVLTKFLVIGYVVSQFFLGLTLIIAGVILKILLFAAIMGRIAGIMAVARAATALWAAVLTGQLPLIATRFMALMSALFRLTAISRLFTLITSLTWLWTAAQAALGAVMATTLGPILLIIAAIALIAGGLYLAYQNIGWFKDAVDVAWAAVSAAFVGLWENNIKPVVDWIVQAWDWLGQRATEAGRWIVEAWENVLQFFRDLPGMIVEFFNKLPGMIGYALGFLIGTIARWIVDFANLVADGLINGWNAIVDFFTALPGNVEQGLNDFGDFLGQKAEEGWNNFTDSLSAAGEATWEWIKAAPGRAVDALGELDTFLSEAGHNLWNGFWDGMSVAADATWEWLKAAPGRIADFFVGADQWLSDAGHWIWDGLMNGLKNGWDILWGWLVSIWDGFIQGFQDAFGIASPSTVFYEFGMWILEGLLNGLKFFGELVLGWIAGFADLVLGVFGLSLNNIKALWDGFWTSGFGQAVQAAWDGVMMIIGAAFDFVKGLFTGNTELIQQAWNTFWGALRATVDLVFGIINAAVETALAWVEDTFGISMEAVRLAWDTFWGALRDIAQIVFDAIRVVIETVWGIISALFQAAIALITGDWDGFWTYLQQAATLAWQLIQGIIDTAWNIIKTIFQAAVDWVVGIWTLFWDGLKATAETVFGAVRDAVGTVLDAIKNAFNVAVDAIKTAWDKIREIVAAPIRFMVDVVYNNGIVPAWNFLADLVGLGKLDKVNLGFAKGGVVPDKGYGTLPGYSPGRDTMLAAVSPGEAWLRPEISRALGSSYIDQLNYAARTGGVTGVKNLMRFGGESRHDFAYAAGGVVPAQNFAKGEAGKPYVWGGVGPGGYDCSGFMSALANVALGLAAHSRRFATGSFGPGKGAGGFVPGTGSAFVIGVSPDTGSGIGHMAGSLGGLGVEARGGDGVVVGGGARSPTNSMFPWQFYLPQVGGFFVDSGGVDILGELTKLWEKVTGGISAMGQFAGTLWGKGAVGLAGAMASGTWDHLMNLLGGGGPPDGYIPGPDGGGGPRNAGGGGRFDQGGVIQPGWNSIYNGTGRPELAGRTDQWAKLIDSDRVNIPGRDAISNLDRTSLDRLNGTMTEVRDLLERRGAGATVIVEGSKNPNESGRSAALALRLS